MRGQEVIARLSYKPNLYACSPTHTKKERPEQPKPKFPTSLTLKSPIDP